MSEDEKGKLVAHAGTTNPSLAELAARPVKRFPGTGKAPPPEPSESVRIRMLVIFSFWAVVVFLGLPIWWRTTSIYRARLPLKEMLEWGDGKACRPVFPLRVSIDAPLLQMPEAEHLLRTTQHALDDLNDFSAHHLRLQLTSGRNMSMDTGGLSQGGVKEDEDAALIIKLLPGESGTTPNAALQPYSPILDVFYNPTQVPSPSSSSSPLATFIANKLQEVFAEEQALIAYILSTGPSPMSPSPSPKSPKALSPELADSLAKRTTRSLKYAPTYHLTFSLFTPGPSPSSWDIEAALSEYMKPLLDSLFQISNFTIDTQVQLYARPSVQPTDGVLRKENLSGFINAAEWPLSPSIGAAPTVNFILYVPDRPLVIEDGATSWLIPQWGGVVLAPAPASSDTIDKAALQPVMNAFSHQLLSLLGTPRSGSLPLRLLTLTRVRSAGLLLSASSTLGSLARLVVALPSISIPRTVASSVERAIAELRLACEAGSGDGGLRHAREAEREVEKAFFDKSMVGQVYFPDEHKIAVYLPLLGPVGVPLVLGLVKEVKRVLGGRRRAR